MKFEKVMKGCANIDDFFFVQVGAFDGVSFDPINKYVTEFNWSGLLVEPIPCHFNSLKKNYINNKNLIFEQVAVTGECGFVSLGYYPPDSKYVRNKLKTDVCRYGESSIGKHLNRKKRKIRKFIREVEVEAITYKNLVERNDVHKVDFLQIDTEGHDFEVIKSIGWDDIHSDLIPNIIHFESNLLNMDEVSNFLINRGYSLYEGSSNIDTLAIKDSDKK